jgi:hypothetical protein
VLLLRIARELLFSYSRFLVAEFEESETWSPNCFSLYRALALAAKVAAATTSHRGIPEHGALI